MKLMTTCATLALTLGLTAASNAAIIFTADGGSEIFGVSGAGSNWDTNQSADSGNANIYWDADTDSTFGETGIGENSGNTDASLAFSFNAVSGSTYSFAFESFGGTDGVATATVFLNGISTALTEGTQANFNDGVDDWTIDFDFAFEGTGDVVSNVGNTPNAAGNDHLVTLTFVNTTAVPEPSSTALLGLGGLALILRRRK